VQAVVPVEGITVIGSVDIALPVEGAVRVVAGDVEWLGAVEIGIRAVVDIEHLLNPSLIPIFFRLTRRKREERTYQSVGIKDSQLGASPLRDNGRSLILVDLVSIPHKIPDILTESRKVGNLYVPVSPKHTLAILSTVLLCSINRSVLKRRHVLQDKVPGTRLVEIIEGTDDAVGDVDETDIWKLLMRNEGVGTDIVGTDPDGVDGLAGLDLEELGVGLVGWDLVFANGWEEGATEGSGSEIVGADGTGDGVVVECSARVLRDVTSPSAAAGSSVLTDGLDIPRGRNLAVVAADVVQASFIRVT
jgi:hypothetical protein